MNKLEMQYIVSILNYSYENQLSVPMYRVCKA